MDQGAYGLPTKALVSLALMQSTVQGILIPMLATFITTKSDHRPWFKFYVVFVNVLSLGQTIIHIIQAFDAMNALTERIALVAAAPILTGLIGASVQAFFAYRCWRIYHQRILAIIPLLLLWLVALVSAIVMGAFLVQTVVHGPTPGTDISTVIWVISSLLFDLIATSSTVAYLYGVRKELSANRNTLLVVWNVIWASATPPFVLIVIALANGCLGTTTRSSGVISIMAAAMSAKSFVLSLMINLVGQGYIRQRFERPYPSPPGNLQSSSNQTDRFSAPGTTELGAHITDVELLPRTSLGVVGTSDDGSGRCQFDNTSVACPSVIEKEGDLGHTVHDIQLRS
ncbi:transmembrane protein, putative [Rhizoctonia solani AG-3 Rhs1AP]|uniref:Transmembrane protein, putative n=1 Tax=Rhizoctonia solani AG-3 Rhs1AP TaxID=1086054 RepID=X8IYN2_9AGAM|nr:transmembrane protein, putative [Rhizoctonia solani AG-3 Rhs1AP]